MASRFEPIEEFTDPDTGSVYVKGLSYTVRNKMLMEKLGTWLSEGKVKLIEHNGVTIKGTGEIP